MRRYSRPVLTTLTSLAALATAHTACAQAGQSTIVVTAPRDTVGAVEGIEPDRSIDGEATAAYAANSIGEVIEQIQAEEGDTEEPLLLVNGVPVEDPGDIVDYPPEAIARVDVLPRGAGARLGGRGNQRAYNVVLRNSFSSVNAVLGAKAATEGGWRQVSGQLDYTRIAGQRRLNLTLRARDEDALLESERGLLQPAPLYPYTLAGTVIPDPRGGATEIDPALSLLAGRPVTSAGVPANAGSAPLSAFAALAGPVTPLDLGPYRTLRPASRNHEISASVNHPLAEGITAGLTGRIERDAYQSRQGLRGGLLLLPQGSAFSAFTRPVAIARQFAGDPLATTSSYLRGNAAFTLNATLGQWFANTRLDYRYSRYATVSQRQRQSATNPLDLAAFPAVDPYGDAAGSLLTLYDDRSLSVTQEKRWHANATGPLLTLPGGPVRANLSAFVRRVDQVGRNDSPFLQSARQTDRSEQNAQGSLEIPLIARAERGLGLIGDLAVTLDHGITHVHRAGSIRRQGYTATWKPVDRLTLQGSLNRQRLLPENELRGDALYESEGVRYFDAVTGNTVDVTLVNGGNPTLEAERVSTRQASVIAMLVPAIALQLTADYTATRRSNPISNLPPGSADLMLAFPERFQRDTAGRLVRVDARPLNVFARSGEQLRWGVTLLAPLGAASPARPGAAATQPSRLQFAASHTVNLSDRITPRQGQAAVDLLDGAALGYAGGGLRHIFDASATFSTRGWGAKLNGQYRGPSRLRTGTPANPGDLRFGPLIVASFQAYAEMQPLLPRTSWLNNTRLALTITNLANRRQLVTDHTGATPLRYQPAFRDPLGRTVELELRRRF